MSVFRAVLLFGAVQSTWLGAALTMGVPEPFELPMIAADRGNPAQPAIRAFNKGRHIEAARLAKPLAEAGNAEALLILGILHEGEPSAGLAVDYLREAHQAGNWQASRRLVHLLVARGDADSRLEAQTLLESLAHSGSVAAARYLGEGSLRGWFDDEPDFEQASRWWKQAAERGDVEAILSLGSLLDGSWGFPEKRDPAAALGWFLKAAELQNPGAMVSVGSRLLSGEKSLRDEEAGRRWLTKAIARGQADAWLALGDFEEMIRKDDEAALEHYRKGAQAGQTGCMIKLAEFFSEGRAGGEKDPDEALNWLRKAGAAGNALGHYRAAAILLKGEDPQVREGFTHLVAAAEAGFPGARNEVGLFYLSERLGPRDPTAAAAWFRRSAERGSPNGAFHLGTLLEQGIGVPRDVVKAGRLYSQAANTGHPQATSALGRLHARGAGTRQNLPKAWALISLAIERGDAGAKAPLEELASQLTEKHLAKGRRLLEEFKNSSRNPGISR